MLSRAVWSAVALFWNQNIVRDILLYRVCFGRLNQGKFAKFLLFGKTKQKTTIIFNRVIVLGWAIFLLLLCSRFLVCRRQRGIIA